MSHPAPATLPCPGAPRSGTGAQAVVSCESSSTRQATGGITPKANNPRGMCIKGVGYRQNENGASGWSATDQGLTAYVEYWWCPVTSAYSGQYPNGINWSWGTVKPASGCATVSVGTVYVPAPIYTIDFGAEIWQASGTHMNDGEGQASYYVCASSPTGYVWDYPQVGSVTYAWLAYMSGAVTCNPSNSCFPPQKVSVQSPNYQ